MHASTAYPRKLTQFGLPEFTLGPLPGMSGTFRLAKLIGLSHAKEFAVPATCPPIGRVTRKFLKEGHTASASHAMEAEAGVFGVLTNTEDVVHCVSSMCV